MKKEYDFSKSKRGSVIAQPKGKTRITIRIDDEILEWFRQQAHKMGGGNYQTLINEALRQYIRQRPESFEMVMRRVVQEELKKMTEKPSRRKAA